MDKEKTLRSLSILARCQNEATNKDVAGHGICFASTTDDKGIEIFSLDYKGLENTSREDPGLEWSHAAARSERHGDLSKCKVYCTTPTKEMRLMTTKDEPENVSSTVVVDLHELTAEHKGMDEVKKYRGTQLPSGSTDPKSRTQTFLPLAVDDYFMAVAILSKTLSTEGKPSVGACVVSNETLHVVSLGYTDGETHAELCALFNAKKTRIDLKKCALYTTKPPCLHCTEAIIQAGIRDVIYGGVPARDLEKDIEDLVYNAKACFKNYNCYITIDNNEKKFLINLSACDVIAKALKPPSEKEKEEEQNCPVPLPKRPSYRDFFMAMAFLSHTRAKDIRYQVGACLVTPSPHRLVAMGYNGMPDGRGFRDDKMDWGTDQKPYTCHGEMNAIIAGFRREADLSACTLYVTHSPCADCSKLVAQSGIKNVVFAKYYKKAAHTYETLGRLPDMNIIRYEYMESGYGNIAKMTIDLKNLTVELSESTRDPQTEWNSTELPTPKGQRDVDFPIDDYFMALAVLAQSRSPFVEKEKRVGACLVIQEPRRAISVGYSGFIDGFSDGKKKDKKYECCAESNAIVSAFRYHADLTSATLYTTGIPCPRCATTIVQSGIKTVVYGRGDMESEAVKIFYWAKVATLKHQVKTNKPTIEIDLRGLIVEQR